MRVLDVGSIIEITDCFVVCSGATERQVRALVIEIEKAVLPRKPLRREGERELTWVLLDYGDVVVHVFAQPEREFYEIERLWSDAPRIDFGGEDFGGDEFDDDEPAGDEPAGEATQGPVAAES